MWYCFSRYGVGFVFCSQWHGVWKCVGGIHLSNCRFAKIDVMFGVIVMEFHFVRQPVWWHDNRHVVFSHIFVWGYCFLHLTSPFLILLPAHLLSLLHTHPLNTNKQIFPCQSLFVFYKHPRHKIDHTHSRRHPVRHCCAHPLPAQFLPIPIVTHTLLRWMPWQLRALSASMWQLAWA